MFEKKTDKVKHETKPRDDGVELENQFILQIPDEPAKTLHEALQTGNLKDRLSIKMESDLRYGEVRFDHWLLHAKIVDLPTVIECLKTIDNKSFYKSADICQLVNEKSLILGNVYTGELEYAKTQLAFAKSREVLSPGELD